MTLAELQGLRPFLYNKEPPPLALVNTQSSSSKDASLVKSWLRTDRLLKALLYSTLSKEILAIVLSLNTSTEIWSTLHKSLAQLSAEQEYFLVHQL
jgi:hypothetical protein